MSCRIEGLIKSITLCVALAPALWAGSDSSSGTLKSIISDHGVLFDDQMDQSVNTVARALVSKMERARVLAIGEPTHGSDRCTDFKRRLCKEIAKNSEFGVLLIEGTDDLVLNERIASIEDLLARKRYSDILPWTLPTGVEFLDWARSEFENRGGVVRGLDEGREDLSKSRLKHLLSSTDLSKESQDIIRVSKLLETTSVSPQRTSLELVVDSDLNQYRELRFSSSISTENDAGTAWISVRLKIRDRENGAYMDSRYLPVSRDSILEDRILTLPLPPGTLSAELGLHLSGGGVATFTNIQVTLDQIPWDGLEARLTTAARSSSIRSKLTGTGEVQLIREGSKGSVQLKSMPANKTPRNRHDSLRSLADDAENGRLLKRTDGSSLEMADLIRRLARIDQRREESASRDSIMAEFVGDILRRYPSKKVLIWCHNEHASLASDRLGGLLRRHLGDGYQSVAVIENLKETCVVDFETLAVKKCEVPEAKAGDLEAVLSNSGPRSFFLPSVLEACDELGKQMRLISLGIRNQTDARNYHVPTAEWDSLIWLK